MEAGGQAAIIYVHRMQSEALVYSEPVSNFSTIYHGELRATSLAVEQALTDRNSQHSKELALLSNYHSRIHMAFGAENMHQVISGVRI